MRPSFHSVFSYKKLDIIIIVDKKSIKPVFYHSINNGPFSAVCLRNLTTSVTKRANVSLKSTPLWNFLCIQFPSSLTNPFQGHFKIPPPSFFHRSKKSVWKGSYSFFYEMTHISMQNCRNGAEKAQIVVGIFPKKDIKKHTKSFQVYKSNFSRDFPSSYPWRKSERKIARLCNIKSRQKISFSIL